MREWVGCVGVVELRFFFWVYVEVFLEDDGVFLDVGDDFLDNSLVEELFGVGNSGNF